MKQLVGSVAALQVDIAEAELARQGVIIVYTFLRNAAW